MRNSRRGFLASVGAAVAATTGCVGESGTTDPGEADISTDEATSGDTDEGGANAVAGDCAGMAGSSTAFDPGGRPFAYRFDYPDTFEEYNEASTDADTVTVQLGHVASATTGSYPVNVMLYHLQADEEAATDWASSYGQADQLDWEFEYQGETVTGYDSSGTVGEDSGLWRLLLPAPEGSDLVGLHLQFRDTRGDASCLDRLSETAKRLAESLRPNPDWSPETPSER